MTFISRLLIFIVGFSISANLLASTKLSLAIGGDSLKGVIEASRTENRVNGSAGFMLTEDRGDLFFAGLYNSAKAAGAENIYGGFGVRVYHLDLDAEDLQALGAGVFGVAGLPVEGLTVDAELYYSPSLAITDDADGFLDFSLNLNYQLFENSQIFIGLRNVEVQESQRDFTIDDDIYIGFKIDLN